MLGSVEIYPRLHIPIERSCEDCRFGAGLPQGPGRLMRCVHPGHPTCGQFLRGPVTCEGFEDRTGVLRRSIPAPPAGAICRDCTYAELHAVERACTCAHPAATPGQRLRSTHSPACLSFTARETCDLILQTAEPLDDLAAVDSHELTALRA